MRADQPLVNPGTVVDFACGKQQVGKAKLGGRIIRLQAHGTLEGFDCGSVLSLRFLDKRQIVAPIERLGFEQEGPLITNFRGCILLMRMEHHPEAAVCPGVARIAADLSECLLNFSTHSRSESVRGDIGQIWQRQLAAGRRSQQGDESEREPAAGPKRHIDYRINRRSAA